MSTSWTRLVIILTATLILLAGPMTTIVSSAVLPAEWSVQWEKVSPELHTMLASDPWSDADIIIEMKVSLHPQKGTAAKPEQRAKNKLEQHGGKRVQPLGIVAGASGRISLDRLARLSRDSEVRYISLDSRLVPNGTPFTGDMIDFARAVNASALWEQGISGAGVTVAVLDSGVQSLPSGIDPKRIVAAVDLVTGRDPSTDKGGHGTNVAGIIAGFDPSTSWSGIAPKSQIASVKVINDQGSALKSQVIRGIQWSVQNRRAYGIRIINLSLGAPAATSYKQDPLATAVEIAWHAGIVVVTAAGNAGPGPGTIVGPGYDPFVITAGAIDMNATLPRADDMVAQFSSRGPTIDSLTKPDVVAPGRKIVSSRVPNSFLEQMFPDRKAGTFIRLSGTSQAAAAVSGVVALMLSANPRLTPDQVKHQLKASASTLNGSDRNAAGAGYVNAAEATKSLPGYVNQSARPADGFREIVLATMKGGGPLKWKDLKHNNGVDSRGTLWSNVAWDNVAWDNISWDNVSWDNVAWDNISWDNVAWDNVTWDNVTWDNVAWDNVSWDVAGKFD